MGTSLLPSSPFRSFVGLVVSYLTFVYEIEPSPTGLYKKATPLHWRHFQLFFPLFYAPQIAKNIPKAGTDCTESVLEGTVFIVKTAKVMMHFHTSLHFFGCTSLPGP
ncbi:hypothetical protein GOODEAATRI_001841 [Goodea atripinnis]|uniref:Uncharacterized protein n=1 Tax=Goodea atripinnis TaxID=208336 RepID=A0ABV0P489_9TELE